MITRNEILSAAHSADRYANVPNLMKTNVRTISPDADLFADGYRALQESGLRALPVVEGTQLVGMLTIDGVGQASFCATSTGSSSKGSGSCHPSPIFQLRVFA